MDKRNIVLLIFFIFLFLFIVTLVEMAVNSFSHIEPKEEHFTYKPIVKTEEELNTQNVLVNEFDKVLELFRARDYKNIYDKMSKLYRDAKYPTYDVFVEEMNKLIKEDSIIDIDEKFEVVRGYYAKLKIDNDVSVPITVKFISDDELSIEMDNSYLIFEIDDYMQEGNVELNFKYCIKYLDKIGYMIDITNTNGKSVNFAFLPDSYEYLTGQFNGKKYSLINSINFTLNSNETKRVEIQFPVVSGEMIQPDMMALSFSVNDKTYERRLDVSYDEQYFSM